MGQPITLDQQISAVAREIAMRRIAHATEPGAPSFWFYEGSVEWDDGGRSSPVEIAPWAVCYDHDDKAADREFRKLSDMLMDYLRKNGKWTGTMWKPKQKFGHMNVAEVELAA